MELEKNSYLSDICIMVPYYGKIKEKKINSIISSDIVADHLLTELAAFSEYECNNIISQAMKRYYLGEYIFACMNDDYNVVLSTELPKVFLSYNEDIELGILMLYISLNKFSTSLIGDHMSADELYVSKDNRAKEKADFLHIDDFI